MSAIGRVLLVNKIRFCTHGGGLENEKFEEFWEENGEFGECKQKFAIIRQKYTILSQNQPKYV